MVRVIMIVLVVMVLLAAVFIFFSLNSGPDLKSFAHLKQPQIRPMKSQPMIEVQFKGDPNITAGKAIGQLYGIFYRLKNNRIRQAAPRARWPVSLDENQADWNGIYGLPVSETVTAIPVQKNETPVKLTTWEYGTIAEILHVGPYNTEQPTIEKLKNFIKDNGYEIVGDHEEEYLKGPGLWPTDPKQYHTIIRYRIQKK
jgi:effector-binding domain-containing protein